jgi:hypothetical protein
MARAHRLTSEEIQLAFEDEAMRFSFPPILTPEQLSLLLHVNRSTVCRNGFVFVGRFQRFVELPAQVAVLRMPLGADLDVPGHRVFVEAVADIDRRRCADDCFENNKRASSEASA